MDHKIILVIFPHLGMGGVEKSLEFVANAYAEAGNSVHVLSLDETSEMHVRLDAGISIESLPLPKGTWNRVIFLRRLRKTIKRYAPDVILVFRTDLTRIVAMAARKLGLIIISSERGNPERYSAAQKKKYEKALSRCSKIVFQTEHARAFFSREIREKGVIIPNPCITRSEPKTFDTGRIKVILSCGRLSAEKNFAGLFRAFTLISGKIPTYELHVYGAGPEKEKLELLIRELKNERIKIYPTVGDVFAKEGDASLFVLNSFNEGMPNALMEAMAVGIPCISSDCPGGVTEYLADGGKRICLVPRGDDGKLAEAMLDLIQNPEKAQLLAKNAVEIKEILSPEIIKKKWIDLLKEV